MKHHPSRRSFLLEAVAGTALLPTALTTIGEAFPGTTTKTNNESYWELIRRQFAFGEEKIPMNAANLCPSPRAVAERVASLTENIDLDCSSNNRAKFKSLLEESRTKVASHLGVTADEIALVRNTSEANNTINNGLMLEAGDEIVVWDQNHPTNNVAWDVRAARFGLSIQRVSVSKNPKTSADLVAPFEKALTSKTKVLAITHLSNVSGIRLPVKELTEIAHQRGIHLHLDGAQTWGALNVNLKELGVDSYSASAHKWFCGPKEAGVLYVKADRISHVWPNVVAPGWGNDVDPDVNGARKFESMGQRDDACLASIGTAIDFHHHIGYDKVEGRMIDLATKLKVGLHDVGVELVTPMEPGLSGGVCIINVPVPAKTKILNAMYDEHGIAGSTAGGFRLSPHIYNTPEHIERAVRGIATLRQQFPEISV